MNLLTFSLALSDAATRGHPVLDELIAGSILVFILNYLLVTYLFKRKRHIIKHIAIVLICAIAFVINFFLFQSPWKAPVRWVYTFVFIACYYFILWKGPEEKGFMPFIPGFIMSLFYTLCVMMGEGTYRAIVYIGDITALVNDPSGMMQKYLIFLPVCIVLVVLTYFIDKAIQKSNKNKSD